MAKHDKLKEQLRWGLQRLLPQKPQDQPEGLTMPDAASKDTAFRLTGILSMVIALMVVVFGGLLGLRLYRVMGLGDNGPKNIPIVYLKAGGTLRYYNQLMEHPATIASGVALSARDADSDQQAFALAKDGRNLLYMQQLGGEYGQLWLAPLPWTMKPDEVYADSGIMLADQVLVGSAQFLSDGSVLYQRTDGGDRSSTNLCRWSKKGGEEVLDIYLSGAYSLLENSNVCYLKKVDNTSRLVVLELPKKVGQLPIIRIVEEGDIEIQRVDKNYLYYSLKTNKTFSLKLWNGDSTRELATEISQLVDIGPKGEVFFIRQTNAILDFSRYFEDDMAVQDSALTQPVEEDFYVETKNLWGKVTKALDQKAFDAAVEAYQRKQQRDELRVAIAQQKKSYTTYVLCHTAGNSSSVVDDSIRLVVTADAASASAVYYKERSTIAEKFRLSAITDVAEVDKMVNTVLNNTVRDYYYAQLGTQPNQFQTVSPSQEQLEVLLDGGKGLYILRGTLDKENPSATTLEAAGGTLFYAAVEQGELGGTRRVDDKVRRVYNQPYQGQRLYQKLTGADTADLYSVQEGKKTQLTTGLSRNAMFYLHDDTVVGYTGYHEGRQTGALLLDAGRQKTVAEGVHDYSYRTDNYMYLLDNYDAVTGVGDLWLYTGNPKKLRHIDSNILIMQRGAVKPFR